MNLRPQRSVPDRCGTTIHSARRSNIEHEYDAQLVATPVNNVELAVYNLQSAVAQDFAELSDCQLVVGIEIKRDTRQPALPDWVFLHSLDPARVNASPGEQSFDAVVPIKITLAVEHLGDALYRSVVRVFELRAL